MTMLPPLQGPSHSGIHWLTLLYGPRLNRVGHMYERGTTKHSAKLVMERVFWGLKSERILYLYLYLSETPFSTVFSLITRVSLCR